MIEYKTPDEWPKLEFYDELYGEKQSIPVLVFTDKFCVGFKKQYDDISYWYTDCSETWDITKYVKYWMYLPPEMT